MKDKTAQFFTAMLIWSLLLLLVSGCGGSSNDKKVGSFIPSKQNSVDAVLQQKKAEADRQNGNVNAYAKVNVRHPEKQLPELLSQPIETWKDTVVNDFEASVFSKYPEIAAIKDKLYDMGAVYASMSGSGSSVFGIFEDPVENVDEIFTGMFCRQRELL